MNLITIILLLPLLAIIIVLFLIPERGLFSFSRKAKRDHERIIVEDSLKHIFDCEHNNEIPSLSSLSKHLSASMEKTRLVLHKLKEIGLIHYKENSFNLTPEGKIYALRVIRIHRLLEKYLADSTGVNETDWHSHAEDREHLISYEEANRLASRMGNPLFDPHGDPIPTAEGKMPEIVNLLLTNLKVNDFAQIAHIEDEPKSVYSAIISLGLSVGMVFRIDKVSLDSIKIESNGIFYDVVKSLSDNISVNLLTETESIVKNLVPLTALKLNENALIYSLSKTLRGEQRRRIMDFGIVPGTKITPVLHSLGKDPTAYSVRNTTIALRKHQANQILVRRIKSDA